MVRNDTRDNANDEDRKRHFRNQLTRVGCISLALSIFFLWLSGLSFSPLANGSDWSFAILILLARTFGIGAFLTGAALLVLQAWTAGTLLIIGSIALPCIAFVSFGVI